MLGYLGNTALTEEVLVEGGWLRTGDMMQRDSEGRLSFVTRLGDMFTVGGFNVYPAQVERTLTRHPEIDSAVVVPVADQRLGSVPVAFVVRSGGRPGRARLDEESILAHCKADLRNYMVPRYVFLLETLPLNRAGKVDRPKLAQQAEETYVD
jgi:acyl-CoA synthetase (AMP-forming)/AMP-acid ligase II